MLLFKTDSIIVMTPELKTACEVVFQEHKLSIQPIAWSKYPFRGRISLGLSEMAKETLVKKNIIYFPNRAKKIATILNPAVATASTFEEAAEMAQNKVPSLVSSIEDEQPVYIANRVTDFNDRPTKFAHRVRQVNGQYEIAIVKEKWYLKPLFYYVIWPACASVLGVLIAYLMYEYIPV